MSSSLSRTYLGTRLPSIVDMANAEMPDSSGIYVGIVKQIDTSTRTGRLLVYVKQLGGPDPDDSSNWKLVSYASPYFGRTAGKVSTEYAKATSPDANTFLNTTQSYGFYMIPPDIGNQVLCCFIKGTVEGYWFACVNNSASIYMTPGIGAVEYKFIDPISIQNSGFTLDETKKYPVGEWNENLEKGYSKPTKEVPKPLHIYKTAQLLNQGLDGDEIRGTITSSSQRDPISSVFGFSTPGRPIPPQDPAENTDLATKLSTGNFNAAEFTVSTRVGGHSMLLDDGDIYGKNNLVRLRSAAGHQILMHDTEGLIYISNASGTAWVELTKEGDILIYGARDMAVRTAGNLMMHSDKNISFFANEDINFASKKNINVEAQEINQTASVKITSVGKKVQLKSDSTFDMIAAGSMSSKSTGKMTLNGSIISLNGSGGGSNIDNPPALEIYSLPDVSAVPNGIAVQNLINEGSITSTNYRVPTHEPYVRVSVDPVASETETVQTNINGDPVSPPTITNPQGLVAAATTALTKAASAAAFITQSIPAGAIGDLSVNNVRAHLAQLGNAESGGAYNLLNEQGFAGKYQFSSEDLSKLGYIKEGLSNSIETLSNPNNWISKDNIANINEFLQSPQLQEQGMFELTKNSYAKLQELGAIAQDTANDVKAGLLSVAHLSGPEAAAEWFKSGKLPNGIDASTAAEYFNRGKFSTTQTDLYKD